MAELGLYEAAALSLSQSRAHRCFLCKWIAEDLGKNGKLTGYPSDAMGAAIFPLSGKQRHLEIERSFH